LRSSSLGGDKEPGNQEDYPHHQQIGGVASMWKALNDNIEAILTGLQVSLADLKEFVGNIWYRGETLRGEIFLQELLVGSKV
jgi:hypothetical protein